MTEADFDFRFRCRVTSDSEYFGILSYYKELSRLKRGQARVRKLILANAFNYWQPFVCLKKERQKALESAVICMYRIERKIEGLKAELASRSGGESLSERPESSEIVFALVSRITRNNPSEIELARYLREKENFSSFEKILWSSDAFSGVTAYRELKIYDGKQIREKTEKCIDQLEQHLRFLHRFFPEISEYPERSTESERWNASENPSDFPDFSEADEGAPDDGFDIADLLL